MDGTPGRNAGIDQAFAQGVLEALRQQSEDHNAERREEMQLMLRSAMLDRQELQQQMRDAMLQMQEAMAEQTRQLREVMAEQKAEQSQQLREVLQLLIPAAASPPQPPPAHHIGAASNFEQRDAQFAMQLQFQQDMKIFMTQQMQEMKHVLLQRVEEHKVATAAAQEQQGQQMQEMQQIQQAFSSDMKCVQRDLQRLQHEPPPNHAKVQQIDQLRTDAQQKFADLMFQVGSVHDSLEGIQESSVEAQMRAELQQAGARQMLEELRTELQQVQSRQGDLDAAIKEQHAKLTGGADEAPCTLADCLAQHEVYHRRLKRLEVEVFNDEDLDTITTAEANAKKPEDTFDDWPERQRLPARLDDLEYQVFCEDWSEYPFLHERLAELERRSEHHAGESQQQMKQSEAEMQALKARCEEQASTYTALQPELEELRQVQRVHSEQVQAIERAHAEQCATLRVEHAAQMKQSEAEM